MEQLPRHSDSSLWGFYWHVGNILGLTAGNPFYQNSFRCNISNKKLWDTYLETLVPTESVDCWYQQFMSLHSDVQQSKKLVYICLYWSYCTISPEQDSVNVIFRWIFFLNRVSSPKSRTYKTHFPIYPLWCLSICWLADFLTWTMADDYVQFHY